MSERVPTPVKLEDVRGLVSAIDEVVTAAVAAAARTTNSGKAIDDHQVHAERIAYVATELEACKAITAYAADARAAGAADANLYVEEAAVFAGEVAAKLYGSVRMAARDFALPDGLLERTVGSAATVSRIGDFVSEDRIRAVGRCVAERKGTNNSWLPSEDVVMVRDSVRGFAEQEVAPLAEHIHRHDDLVPDSLIGKMAEMGYFGMAVPEAYGGLEMGNLAMIITTEELSRVSLAAAGSLITRPEILTKALLKGGTEEQKRQWLGRVAAGEIMVGISVTEPDVGSDVASVACRAAAAEVGGRKGYRINGAKRSEERRVGKECRSRWSPYH